MRDTEQLVEASKAGDADAITQLVERYEHTLLVTVWAIVGDFHHAQDVAQDEKKYFRILEATKGWATMNQIMANNVDAAYYGLQVTSADKNKVLFRWKLAMGDYQVIYGDLRSEAVSKEQLSELESSRAK